MDQRRFISFLLISFGVVMLFSVIFPPKPRPKQPPPAAAKKADDAQPAKGAGAPAEKPADVQPAQAPQGSAEPAQLAESKAVSRLLAVGSLDPADGYRLLATFTTDGAALRRVELSSPRYRDQLDRSGYLGELELKQTPDGLQAQVVGPGTPAALAGIQAGDVIVGIAKAPITNIASFNAALARTKPEQQVTLQVRRADSPPQDRVATLIWRPMAVLRPEIENYAMRDAEPPAGFIDRPSLLLSLAQLNDNPLDADFADRIARLLESGSWEVAEQTAASIAFVRRLPELKLEITKRYTLPTVPADQWSNPDYPAYHVQLQIELKNTADQARKLAYRLDGPTGMPLEGWWYGRKVSGGLRDVVVRFAGRPELLLECSQIAQGKTKPMGEGHPLAYAGVDGQYFSAVLIPKPKPLDELRYDTTEAIVVGPKPEPRPPFTYYANVTCRLNSLPITIEPNEAHTDSFQVFIGPKRPSLLAQYQAADDPDYSLTDVVYYGWPIFAVVARVMLAILHFFHAIVGNYGIAIVMLTVLVRGAMFPLSYRQTKSMARMQALKPEMDRITEKYKNDVQKRSQAMQELYRKHQINPLGGCLPMMLQLPVMIGLYKALMVDVELRGSPLFTDAIPWCSNLAAPDMFYNWSSIMPESVNQGIGFFGLGPYLNILPLVTVSLFLVTQRMAMPAPANEQAAMQQKMMKYMTVFMGLMFYKVASGLCLYFIASSLWGIAERKLLPKAKGPDSDVIERRPRTDPRNGPNGQSGSAKPTRVKRKK